MLTAERAREVLAYDPETGVLRWKVSLHRGAKQGQVAGKSNKRGYLHLCIDHKGYLAHRVAWLIFYGVWPDELDHQNQNKGHNAILNLRNSSRSQNMANVSINANNTTGFRGVCWHKQAKRFLASIRFKRRAIHIGLYDTPEEAHKAYKAKARELFGEFAA